MYFLKKNFNFSLAHVGSSLIKYLPCVKNGITIKAFCNREWETMLLLIFPDFTISEILNCAYLKFPSECCFCGDSSSPQRINHLEKFNRS